MKKECQCGMTCGAWIQVRSVRKNRINVSMGRKKNESHTVPVDISLSFADIMDLAKEIQKILSKE